MNLYWPVYLKLEKEVLSLADAIHFSDDQISVYSIQIADLIVRCAVEIEALSKELYKSLGGNMSPVDAEGNKRDLYFDTDCMVLINIRWHLDKKSVTITAPTMYFEKNKRLIPLAKSSKRGGPKWNKAYQALKHNRYENLKLATVGNLLSALGALYLLNVYYKDEKFRIGKLKADHLEFKNELGSSIFLVEFYQAHLFEWGENGGKMRALAGDDLDASAYIIKYEDSDYERMYHYWCLDQRWEKKNFEANDRIKNYLSRHPEDKDKTIKEICLLADNGKDNLYKQIKFDVFVTSSYGDTVLEAVLNEAQDIYPVVQKPTDEELDAEINNLWMQALIQSHQAKKLW